MTSAVTSARRTRATGTFIATKEHRRFVEFADAVRRDSYIGLCFGPAGVGKTLSTRRYANWELAEELLDSWGPREDSDARVYAALARSRSVFYTPTTTSTHRQIDAELDRLVTRVDICIDQHKAPSGVVQPGHRHHAELLIIDEADRLSERALEHIRDRFDRRPLGLLLIGMPGIEKRLARYPQLQPHRLRSPLPGVIWRRAGLRAQPPLEEARTHAGPERFHRCPSGRRDLAHHARKLQAMHRLFSQIPRVMRINNLSLVTSDVVESAGSTLVIGDT